MSEQEVQAAAPEETPVDDKPAAEETSATTEDTSAKTDEPSAETVETPATTDETPAEDQPAAEDTSAKTDEPSAETVETPATTDETPTEDQPAAEDTSAKTDEPSAETPATTDETPAEDQPAVTEVTEVTTETTGEEPKPKEEVSKEKPKEEKPKKEPKKKASKPPTDYRSSKAGWITRQGLLFKKWQRLYMSLDEEDSVLRWWKTENRTGSDGALFMKFCADVCEPKPEATTTWPADTADRCFVVCSPYRAHYMVAETVEEKNEWIQRLSAAKDKHSSESVKVISTQPFASEAIKASFDSGASGAEKTLKEEGVVKDEPKTEGGATNTEGEAPTGGDEPGTVTVEVEVETTEEPKPKEDAPKDEPAAEESPKPAEETPKNETPAAAGEGETEAKPED